MAIYKFDGTINGIFSCIFESFMSNETPTDILEHPIENCFTNIKHILSESDKSNRAIKVFVNFAGKAALNDINYSFKSSNPNKAYIIFSYIRKTLARKTDISNDFTCKETLAFYDLIRNISTETDYYKTQLIFKVANNGVYFSSFSPDNDITELLIANFNRQLPSRNIVIHDQKRNIIGMVHNGDRKFIKIENFPQMPYSEERFIIGLCNDYFDESSYLKKSNNKDIRLSDLIAS